MIASDRARQLVGRVTKRVAFPSDTMFAPQKPFGDQVFVNNGRVQLVTMKWPLDPRVCEMENTIVISYSAPAFASLPRRGSCTFSVYVWDSVSQITYARGNFSLIPSPTKYILKRVTGMLDAERLADDVMQKVNTQHALVNALANSRDEFGEPSPPIIPEKPPQSVLQPARFNGHSRPTVYNKVEYRSLTEARFARALDLMGIPFSFETMTFKRPGGGKYTPDFFLPSQQLLIEIKPARPLIEEEEKCEELSQSGFRIVCMYGTRIGVLPFAHQTSAKRNYDHKEGMRGIAWHNGEKLAGEVAFVVGKNPSSTPSPLEFLGDTNVPHLDLVRSSKDVRWNVPTIQSALEQAGEKI